MESSRHGQLTASHRTTLDVEHHGDAQQAARDALFRELGVSPCTIAGVLAFHSAQWALLRALVVRRFAQFTKDPSPPFSTASVRAALALFRIPAMTSELVSRPERGLRPDFYRGRVQSKASPDLIANALLLSEWDASESVLADVSIVEGQPRATDEEVGAVLSSDVPINSIVWVPGSSGGATSSVQSNLAGVTSEMVVPASIIDPVLLQRITVATMNALIADLIARRRWKTKPCHAWQRGGGVCPRGMTCDFAHGEAELRVYTVPRDSRWKTRICRVFLDTCGRFCSHGDRCSFAHGVADLRIHVPSAAAILSTHGGLGPQAGAGAPRFRNQLCVSWLKVSCFRQDKCYRDMLMSQILYQSAATAFAQHAINEVCTGSLPLQNPDSLTASPAEMGKRGCLFGDDCQYSHGMADLKLPSSMEQDQALQVIVIECSDFFQNLLLAKTLCDV